MQRKNAPETQFSLVNDTSAAQKRSGNQMQIWKRSGNQMQIQNFIVAKKLLFSWGRPPTECCMEPDAWAHWDTKTSE